MGPTQQDGLAQRGNVDRVAGSGVAKVQIEAVATIEGITTGNGISTQLPVGPGDPIEVVGGLRNESGDAAKLDSPATADRDAQEAPGVRVRRVSWKRTGSWAAIADAVRPESVPRLHGGAAGEATIQLGQARRGRRGSIASDGSGG